MNSIDTEALERVCKAATEPDLGELVIEESEKRLLARGRCFDFCHTFNPALVLELLAALKQRDRALEIARDCLRTYSDAETDYQSHLEHKIPEIQRAAIALAAIEEDLK